MVDIDHFKQFNDNFGHAGGDAILRALGAFFKKHVRGMAALLGLGLIALVAGRRKTAA